MKKTFIVAALTLGLSIPSIPGFAAGGYAMNEHPAASSQTPLSVPNSMPLASPSDHASVGPLIRTETGAKRCYYVLDVLLCD